MGVAHYRGVACVVGVGLMRESLLHHYRYGNELAKARKLGVKKGVSVGVSLGLTYFVIFASYGFSFW